jgi:hypothetical protein
MHPNRPKAPIVIAAVIQVALNTRGPSVAAKALASGHWLPPRHLEPGPAGAGAPRRLQGRARTARRLRARPRAAPHHGPGHPARHRQHGGKRQRRGHQIGLDGRRGDAGPDPGRGCVLGRARPHQYRGFGGRGRNDAETDGVL